MDPEKKGQYIKSVLKNFRLENIFVGLIILLGIIVIINIAITFNLNKDISKGSEANKEKLKPAKIELTVIKNSQCDDCFDISTIVSHIRNANANITNEKTLEINSAQGKELVSRFKIEKIPTVVVVGEIDKLNIQGLEKRENALLLTRLEPPYTNAVTGKIEGRVILYHFKDPECQRCSDLSLLIKQIKGAGVVISQEKELNPKSDEAKQIMEKYGIDFAPTIVMSKDASLYTIMQQAWSQIGTRENDGSYVLRVTNPPFVNLSTGKLRGLVDITYLADKECKECYNVTLHRQILSNPQTFSMTLQNEEIVDAADPKGMELITKYNITQVPMIILSNEASVYPSKQVLLQFFTVEKDGAFVFRRVSLVGTYKDLTTNQVVTVQQQQSEEQSQENV